mmetsp:Transcript_6990/g.16520  ORF Transcript_6990/g.16520 Transcript_6990/m.16520 type:complete len:234 (+) Transcript_6990:205-906(+)
MSHLDAMRCGVLLAALVVACPHCLKRSARNVLQGLDPVGSNGARSDYSPTQREIHIFRLGEPQPDVKRRRRGEPVLLPGIEAMTCDLGTLRETTRRDSDAGDALVLNVLQRYCGRVDAAAAHPASRAPSSREKPCTRALLLQGSFPAHGLHQRHLLATAECKGCCGEGIAHVSVVRLDRDNIANESHVEHGARVLISRKHARPHPLEACNTCGVSSSIDLARLLCRVHEGLLH